MSAYARSKLDYVTSWVTHLEPARLAFGPVIVNVVFAGDTELHEAEIRKFWDGLLCVVARDVPTVRELARIRKEVESRRASTTSGSRCSGRSDPPASR